MAVQGDRYATVDASAIDLPMNSLGESSFGGPAGGGSTTTITAYWSYDPDTDTSGFSGISWFGTVTSNSPVSGQADDSINATLTSIYDEAVATGQDGVAAVTNYVTSNVFGAWDNNKLTALVNDHLHGTISAPGCFSVG